MRLHPIQLDLVDADRKVVEDAASQVERVSSQSQKAKWPISVCQIMSEQIGTPQVQCGRLPGRHAGLLAQQLAGDRAGAHHGAGALQALRDLYIQNQLKPKMSKVSPNHSHQLCALFVTTCSRGQPVRAARGTLSLALTIAIFFVHYDKLLKRSATVRCRRWAWTRVWWRTRCRATTCRSCRCCPRCPRATGTSGMRRHL